MEILIAVGIIAVLGAAAAIVARGALRSSRERQTRQTMDVVVNAITVYQGERKQFPRDPYSGDPPVDNGRQVVVNGCDPIKVASRDDYIDDYIEDNERLETWPSRPVCLSRAGQRWFGEFAEHVTVMRQSAEARKILDSLEGNALQRREAVSGGSANRQVWYIVDAWRHEILYRRFAEENNGFPILLSAGRDGEFDTADDIRSDGQEVEVN